MRDSDCNSHDEDELTDVRVRLHHPMCVRRCAQRKCRVHDGRDGAALEKRPYAFADRPSDRALLCHGPRAQPS